MGGDLHADESGQKGPDAAGQKGEGGELGEHVAAGREGDDHQYHEHRREDRQDGLVLPLQIGVGALANGARDLLHALRPFGEGHDLFRLDQGVYPCHGRTDKSNPEQRFHSCTSFLTVLRAKRPRLAP